MFYGALATSFNLRRKHINSQSIFRRCCQVEETSQHLFFYCHYAQSIWRASGINHQWLFDPSLSLDSKMEVLLSRNFATTNVQAHQLVFWILWKLWKRRNQLVF